MKYFQSKYFLKFSSIIWITIVTIIGDYLISKYISVKYHASFKEIFTLVYFLLLISTLFLILFETYSKKEITEGIERARKDLDSKYIYNKIESEQKLQYFLQLNDVLKNNRNFIHIFKSLKKIYNDNSTYNSILLIPILGAGSFSFYYFKPYGIWIFESIIILFLFFLLFSVCYDYIKNRSFTGITIGSAILFFIIFFAGKEGYIRANGDKQIGSFFEKHEYNAKYFINLFQINDSTKKYRVPANIHAYEEEEDTGDQDDAGNERTETVRYYTIEKAYLSKYEYLEFNDCNIKIGDIIECKDQNDKIWKIELTDVKAD